MVGAVMLMGCLASLLDKGETVHAAVSWTTRLDTAFPGESLDSLAGALARRGLVVVKETDVAQQRRMDHAMLEAGERPTTEPLGEAKWLVVLNRYVGPGGPQLELLLHHAVTLDLRAQVRVPWHDPVDQAHIEKALNALAAAKLPPRLLQDNKLNLDAVWSQAAPAVAPTAPHQQRAPSLGSISFEGTPVTVLAGFDAGLHPVMAYGSGKQWVAINKARVETGGNGRVQWSWREWGLLGGQPGVLTATQANASVRCGSSLQHTKARSGGLPSGTAPIQAVWTRTPMAVAHLGATTLVVDGPSDVHGGPGFWLRVQTPSGWKMLEAGMTVPVPGGHVVFLPGATVYVVPGPARIQVGSTYAPLKQLSARASMAALFAQSGAYAGQMPPTPCAYIMSRR